MESTHEAYFKAFFRAQILDSCNPLLQPLVLCLQFAYIIAEEFWFLWPFLPSGSVCIDFLQFQTIRSRVIVKIIIEVLWTLPVWFADSGSDCVWKKILFGLKLWGFYRKWNLSWQFFLHSRKLSGNSFYLVLHSLEKIAFLPLGMFSSSHIPIANLILNLLSLLCMLKM